MNIETDITAIFRECRGRTPEETFKVLAKEIIREIMDKHIDDLLIQRDENPNTHALFGYRDDLDEELDQADDVRQYIGWFGFEEEEEK